MNSFPSGGPQNRKWSEINKQSHPFPWVSVTTLTNCGCLLICAHSSLSLTGPYSCIGKNLAMMEMRAVIARLVTKYDMEFAPGEDGTTALDKMKDTFTTTPGPLKIIFSKRTE